MIVHTLTDRQYRLGVALSGGGARGFAHAGALQALDEMGLTPGVISGVSAGSVISALYGAGMKPADMLRLFGDSKFSTYAELTLNRGGFFKIDKFLNVVARGLGSYTNIEDLNLPTYICATDFDRGLPVAFDNGPILERVAASCSIPIIFKPIKIDGVNYVDGGVLRNLPAWVIRERCDTLIGINCSPSLPKPKSRPSVMEVGMRAYQLMAKSNAVIDVTLCDLVIETRDIANHSTFNLKEIERVFKAGYDATNDAVKRNLWILDAAKPKDLPQ